MLHHRRQLDRERLGELAHRQTALVREPSEDRTPRRVGEHAEDTVESIFAIVHHLVNCRSAAERCQATSRRPRHRDARPSVSVPSTVAGAATRAQPAQRLAAQLAQHDAEAAQPRGGEVCAEAAHDERCGDRAGAGRRGGARRDRPDDHELDLVVCQKWIADSCRAPVVEVEQPAQPFEALDRGVAVGRSHHLFGWCKQPVGPCLGGCARGDSARRLRTAARCPRPHARHQEVRGRRRLARGHRPASRRQLASDVRIVPGRPRADLREPALGLAGAAGGPLLADGTPGSHPPEVASGASCQCASRHAGGEPSSRTSASPGCARPQRAMSVRLGQEVQAVSWALTRAPAPYLGRKVRHARIGARSTLDPTGARQRRTVGRRACYVPHDGCGIAHPRGAWPDKHGLRTGTVTAGGIPVVSYADKSQGAQGSRPEVRSHEAELGKQTLVEQIVAPVVQRRAVGQHDPSGEATVHAAASRGVGDAPAPARRGCQGCRRSGSPRARCRRRAAAVRRAATRNRRRQELQDHAVDGAERRRHIPESVHRGSTGYHHLSVLVEHQRLRELAARAPRIHPPGEMGRRVSRLPPHDRRAGPVGVRSASQEGQGHARGGARQRAAALCAAPHRPRADRRQARNPAACPVPPRSQDGREGESGRPARCRHHPDECLLLEGRGERQVPHLRPDHAEPAARADR